MFKIILVTVYMILSMVKIEFDMDPCDDEIFELEEKMQKLGVKFDTEYDIKNQKRIWYFD